MKDVGYASLDLRRMMPKKYYKKNCMTVALDNHARKEKGLVLHHKMAAKSCKRRKRACFASLGLRRMMQKKYYKKKCMTVTLDSHARKEIVPALHHKMAEKSCKKKRKPLRLSLSININIKIYHHHRLF